MRQLSRFSGATLRQTRIARRDIDLFAGSGTATIVAACSAQETQENR
jgi:hypothetical protein